MLNSVPPVDKIVILMFLLISSCIRVNCIIMFNSQIFSLAYSPGFCTPILYARREFHYIDVKMNWTDAKQYCREKYTDLATIENLGTVKGPYRVWIGMYREPWRWFDNRTAPSKTGETDSQITTRLFSTVCPLIWITHGGTMIVQRCIPSGAKQVTK
uniref:C-type lectin domain-containing protein n=1 Tax=Labrus bergylta TaxID=56723 RepID=A0A3Q3G0B3_9LABR